MESVFGVFMVPRNGNDEGQLKIHVIARYMFSCSQIMLRRVSGVLTVF